MANHPTKMTPQEFKDLASEIVANYGNTIDGTGHIAMDCLMEDCLRSLRYDEGMDVLNEIKHIFY